MSESRDEQPRRVGPEIKEVEFRFVKSIKDNVWLVESTNDNEPFIARRLEEFDHGYSQKEQNQAEINGMWDLLQKHDMMQCLAQILNHENIISIAGCINPKPLTSNPEYRYNTWLVWDYCDAGNLETLWTDKRLLLLAARTPQKFLPESLCWHVLISILRALTWLHDGMRMLDTEDGRVLEEVHDDWMPILHGSITPENIHFQHPRGTEVFGVCKLANFSTAFVSGKTHMYGVVDIDPNPTPFDNDIHEGGVITGLRNGKVGSLNEIRYALDEDARLAPVSGFTFS
jgi:serine/threonine protein kinase